MAAGAGAFGTLFAYDPAAGGYAAVVVDAAAINSGAGTARGFWCYSAQASGISYEGTGSVAVFEWGSSNPLIANPITGAWWDRGIAKTHSWIESGSIVVWLSFNPGDFTWGIWIQRARRPHHPGYRTDPRDRPLAEPFTCSARRPSEGRGGWP